MEVRGKLAIITGASRGIGRSLSIKLAEAGCNLLMTALEEDELKVLVADVRKFGIKAEILPCDISSAEEREKLINWIHQSKDLPDILINNVGIGGSFGKFYNLPFSEISKVIEVNVVAFLHITHALIPLLKKRPRAKIVNISSGVARLPYPGLAVYGATKAFITSFSESLSCELLGTTVDVLCFHPGFTYTSFMETSKMDLRKIPKSLIHSPEYVAERILYAILKDKVCSYSDFITYFATKVGVLLPTWLKVKIFKNLFWELPD